MSIIARLQSAPRLYTATSSGTTRFQYATSPDVTNDTELSLPGGWNELYVETESPTGFRATIRATGITDTTIEVASPGKLVTVRNLPAGARLILSHAAEAGIPAVIRITRHPAP